MSSVLSARQGLLRPLVFSRPLRLVEPTSWVPHIPFAFWLIEALRPRVLVELGTMSGNSFAALAQGIQTLGLDSACYAVDTWQGDPHSGIYGEDIFREWSTFHDQHFAPFSTLVRSTFDEALAKFGDGSIDLLHIDGYHTYDAIRHDFESWLPKLSSKGVVLLHDINERGRDFGAWKFWHELSLQYPCFAFLHAHGLGVVGVGRDLPAEVRALVEDVPRLGDDTFIVRQFFGTLGEALLTGPRDDAQARRELELRGQLSTITAETERLAAVVAQQEQQLKEAQLEASRILASQSQQVDQLQSRLNEAQGLVASQSQQLDQSKKLEEQRVQREEQVQLAEAQARAQTQEDRFRLEEQAERQRTALEKVRQEADAWFALLTRFKSARSWRVTAPLRKGAAMTRELIRRARFKKSTVSTMSEFAFLRPSRARQIRLIRRSGIFDERFYLRHVSSVVEENQDVMAAWADPIAHYLAVGAAAGADPHPLFDTSFYVERHPDVARAGLNPLVHYLQSGGFEGRDPHPLFHSGYYLAQNPDVAATTTNPLVHFMTYGAREGRNPNPLFDTSFYLGADPGFQRSDENPLVHFLRIGGSEGRPTGPSFDTSYYSRANPDVAGSGLNPLVHYMLAGSAEGRRATPRPALPAPGNINSSIEAYEALSLRGREVEASRIRALTLQPPPMIRLSEKDDLAVRARDVILPAERSPLVSIVIPIVNGARVTLECLLSIVQASPEVPVEVIVVDNGSTDGSKELLSSIPNLTYVRFEENSGFGPGCNSGAERARGRHIVFLNNDTQVQPGWLAGLLRPFSEVDHVGAVGPKVLFPDGRLQDAGSVINADCTSSLVGVFDDPNLPRFNCSREVDYVSGVCLMIEAQCFRDLGGFAPAFAPAYCEDVDLCLRIRQKGFRIIYEPSACIVHHLSVTSNELGSSFKMAAVTRNQQALSIHHQAQIDELDGTRLIAFYLPQFHPIPENDVWWGKGFTEWRNVTRARPNFEGHYQPRLAGDLGYYDLRLRDTYLEQVALAERYGVNGFCFYYYWFDGKRLLERPLERLLGDETLDFPFCVCWANENWTRRWDGLEHEVLMAQSHRDEDAVAVIEDLIRYVAHPSYIRVGGRPLLLIYSATRFPDIRKTVQTWRTECRRRGVGEVYLAMVESFELSQLGTTPLELGFDAAVEFPPHHGGLHPVEPARFLNEKFSGRVFGYDQTALHYMTKTSPAYRRFRTVMPSWDNTARRQDDAVIFAGSTPGAYQAWLESVLRQTREQNFGDERLVFINAWNEWAEGAYLEPDLGWGHAYLEATRDARDNVRSGICSR